MGTPRFSVDKLPRPASTVRRALKKNSNRLRETRKTHEIFPEDNFHYVQFSKTIMNIFRGTLYMQNLNGSFYIERTLTRQKYLNLLQKQIRKSEDRFGLHRIMVP